VRDQVLKPHTGLGSRLAGLAILSATLFALATVVGLAANGLA
jgi:hypothetical protein